MKKKTINERSLSEIDPNLLDAIKRMAISPSYMAKGMFEKEWNEEDESLKLKLIGRLRNKLNGSGRLNIEELTKLQNILLDMANELKAVVQQSKQNKILQRKEKIKTILESLKELEVTKEDLKELNITNLPDLKNLPDA